MSATAVTPPPRKRSFSAAAVQAFGVRHRLSPPLGPAHETETTKLMNPLLIVRAVSGAALPIAGAVAYAERRRNRRPDLQEEGDTTERRTTRTAADQRRLRDAVAAGMRLRNADLRGAKLDRMKLGGRDFKGADLTRAVLTRSELSEARLSSACLDHADLSECDLRNADLTGASLTEASLWRADLRGANLEACASLVMANLRGARYDGATRWPADISPTAMGAVRSA
jgi:hypothetical protein